MKSMQGLFLILALGLSLSLVVFTLHDCKVFQATVVCILSTVQAPSRKISKSKHSFKQLHIASTVVSTSENGCPICRDFLFTETKELELHIANNHSEYYFLEAMLTQNELEDYED